MTTAKMAAMPVPHWPGRMVTLTEGERVWLAETGSASPGGRPPGAPRCAPNGTDRHFIGCADGSVPDNDDVLCVHGMAGAATNWTDFMAELAGEFGCAAVDLPGFGLSPPPGTAAGYSVSGLARTVSKVIGEQLRRPVHLVGNSLGGAVAVKLAATRPDLVRTLTLISPALPDWQVHPSLVQFPLLALPKVGTILMRRVGSLPAEDRVAMVMRNCFYDPGAVHPARLALEVAELRRRDKLEYAAATLTGAARTITVEYLRPPHWSLWRDAERIRVPVLAIYGSHDRLVHPRGAARAVLAFRDAPDARVLLLPRTGHVAQMEHPALVAGHFREMVGRVRGMPERATGLSRKRKTPNKIGSWHSVAATAG